MPLLGHCLGQLLLGMRRVCDEELVHDASSVFSFLRWACSDCDRSSAIRVYRIGSIPGLNEEGTLTARFLHADRSPEIRFQKVPFSRAAGMPARGYSDRGKQLRAVRFSQKLVAGPRFVAIACSGVGIGTVHRTSLGKFTSLSCLGSDYALGMNRDADRLPALGVVEVWYQRVADAEATTDDLELLSPRECELHAALRAEARLEYRMAHALLRRVLSRYVPISPKDWVFESDDEGRPRLANAPRDAGLDFNSVSHRRPGGLRGDALRSGGG